MTFTVVRPFLCVGRGFKWGRRAASPLAAVEVCGSGKYPGALLFTHLTMQRQRLRCLRKKGIHPSMNSLFALSILWNI